MAKAKEIYTTRETPASSEKANRVINDYLARGQLIISSTGAVLQTQTGAQNAEGVQTGQLVLIRNGMTLGWYPYNPAKQLFDQMAIIGAFGAVDANNDDQTASMHLQYSINSGTGWTTASLVEVPPGTAFPTLPPQSIAATLDGGLTTVDISAIASFEWLGLRFTFDVTCTAATWMAFAFLYLNTDNPY